MNLILNNTIKKCFFNGEEQNFVFVNGVKVWAKSAIPYPFIQLEYIESDGVQWIETGLQNTGDYIFKDRFYLTAYGSGLPGIDNGAWFIGGRKNPNYSLGVYISDSQVINAYGGLTSPTAYKVPLEEWIELYFSRFELTIGGRNFYVNGKKLIPEEYATEIYLGKNQINWAGTGNDTRNFRGRRKYSTIIDAVTGNILRDYVAARNDITGEVGYYEKFEQKFFANANDGSDPAEPYRPFIAGPDLETI